MRELNAEECCIVWKWRYYTDITPLVSVNKYCRQKIYVQKTYFHIFSFLHIEVAGIINNPCVCVIETTVLSHL